MNQFNTAVDAIRSNALRSILTTLAIIIGTAAVITMVSMGSSAQKAIDDSITKLEQGRSMFIQVGRGLDHLVTEKELLI